MTAEWRKHILDKKALLLKVVNLEAGYGDLQVLKKINLNIFKNEIVALIGQNGAGKTTLLNAIAGFVPINGGDIFYKNESIKDKKIHDIINRGIIMVPEGAGVFPNMNVLDNLLMGAYHIKNKKIRNDNIEKIFTIFPRLRERVKQAAGTLSGGERQMLAIARALMSEPEIIIFDEPSLGLQPSFVNKVFEIIKNLRSMGKTILIVEQNVRKSLEISDRVYVMENGKIVLHGDKTSIENNEYLKKAYLGL